MLNFSLFSNKVIVIFGLGVTGVSALKFLSVCESQLIICDDNEEKINQLKVTYPNAKGTTNIESIDWKNVDYLVLSPGVPLTFPKPHRVAYLARENNCKIICDVEIAYLVNKNPDFIGITGTNGKSTTTSLIGHVLKSLNVNSQIGGNIGIPILDLNHDQNVTNIVEVSSYQLDLVERTRFNRVVFLNITPDHIDRHGTLEKYIEAKTKIFANQKQNDVAIVSVDDEYCRSIYKKLTKQSKAKVIPFSVERVIENGVSLIDNILTDNTGEKVEYKLPIINSLLGQHNAQNLVASYIAVKSYNIDFDQFLNAAMSFEGLPHRMQYVASKNTISLINDSKATNADSAAKALSTYDNIYWIVGGVSKYGGISSLESYFPKVKKAYLIGESQNEFSDFIGGKIKHANFDNLKQAVIDAFDDACESGDESPVVLFSPACASFDQWKNFEIRGNDFIAIVKSL